MYMGSHQNVGLVGVSLLAFLGDQQKFVEQEERSLIFRSLDAECSLENQLAIANQIRTLPVSQQTLNLLRERKSRREGVLLSTYMTLADRQVGNDVVCLMSLKQNVLLSVTTHPYKNVNPAAKNYLR